MTMSELLRLLEEREDVLKKTAPDPECYPSLWTEHQGKLKEIARVIEMLRGRVDFL